MHCFPHLSPAGESEMDSWRKWLAFLSAVIHTSSCELMQSIHLSVSTEWISKKRPCTLEVYCQAARNAIDTHKQDIVRQSYHWELFYKFKRKVFSYIKFNLREKTLYPFPYCHHRHQSFSSSRRYPLHLPPPVITFVIFTIFVTIIPSSLSSITPFVWGFIFVCLFKKYKFI